MEGAQAELSLVTVQQFILSILDNLPMPYGLKPANAYITPPDPRTKAAIPAIYIWPSDGTENRSAQVGGTIPRNTGPGTASGTKGVLHAVDVYVTWFGPNKGTESDPVFPAIVDAIMQALRTSQPNPYQATDPNTGVTSTIYNVGESIKYRVGVESVADQRFLRYDALCDVSVWEIMNA